VRTHSRHFLVNPGFRAAVADALTHEAEAVDGYAAELLAHSPYAKTREATREDNEPGSPRDLSP
jgi:predicted N-acyltransferase